MLEHAHYRTSVFNLTDDKLTLERLKKKSEKLLDGKNVQLFGVNVKLRKNSYLSTNKKALKDVCAKKTTKKELTDYLIKIIYNNLLPCSLIEPVLKKPLLHTNVVDFHKEKTIQSPYLCINM